MTSTSTDLRDGVNSSKAIKAPVRSVCTSNIAASGLSAITTIDGSLTPAAGDRFLLAGQTSSVDNGIYTVTTGTWERAKDFNNSRDVAMGTLIVTQSGIQYRLTASDPITIGTTALTFSSNDNATLATSLASAALGAGASLVGLHDAGALTSADDVEEVIAEILAANWVSTSRLASNSVTPLKLATTSPPIGKMVNGRLDVSVAANALTVALKTRAGTDPSATDPVYILFRDATLTSGDSAVLTITAATSFTVSSGSTLGTSGGVAHRVYIGMANDGGTGRLFAYNPGEGSSHIALDEGRQYSSTTEGGAGGADSEGVLYSAAAFSSKAISLLGYFESTQATAGTWATTPAKVHALRPSDRQMGDLVQERNSYEVGFNSGTLTVPYDNTTPTSTEGDQYLAVAITPTSPCNRLFVDATLYLTNSSTSVGAMTAALFAGSTAAVASGVNTHTGNSRPLPVHVAYQANSGSTSSITFTVRAGLESAGTTYLNGSSTGGTLLGQTLYSTLRVREIQR